MSEGNGWAIRVPAWAVSVISAAAALIVITAAALNSYRTLEERLRVTESQTRMLLVMVCGVPQVASENRVACNEFRPANTLAQLRPAAQEP